MNRTPSPLPEIADGVHALLALLSPAEQASLAGSILVNAGLNAETVRVFIAELSEDDVNELLEQAAE